MKWEHIGKPRPGRQCLIRTVDGEEYEAVWVDRINKYVSCRRWRRTASGLTKRQKWIDDQKVVGWCEE